MSPKAQDTSKKAVESYGTRCHFINGLGNDNGHSTWKKDWDGVPPNESKQKSTAKMGVVREKRMRTLEPSVGLKMAFGAIVTQGSGARFCSRPGGWPNGQGNPVLFLDRPDA